MRIGRMDSRRMSDAKRFLMTLCSKTPMRVSSTARRASGSAAADAACAMRADDAVDGVLGGVGKGALRLGGAGDEVAGFLDAPEVGVHGGPWSAVQRTEGGEEFLTSCARDIAALEREVGNAPGERAELDHLHLGQPVHGEMIPADGSIASLVVLGRRSRVRRAAAE